MLLRNSSLGFGAFGGRGKLLSPGETAGPSTALRSGRDDNSVEAGMEATEKSLSLQQKCHPDRKRTWVKQDRTQPSQRPAFFSFPSPRMECFFSESRMLFLNAITPGYKAFLVLERLQDSPSASAGPSVTPSADERPSSVLQDIRDITARQPMPNCATTMVCGSLVSITVSLSNCFA